MKLRSLDALRRLAGAIAGVVLAGGCNSLIGLGEAPVDGEVAATTSTAADSVSSSGSTGDSVVTSSGSSPSSSSSGGSTSDGGAGGSGGGGGASSASSGGGGGGGGAGTGGAPTAPCGTCVDDASACGELGVCEGGVCRVRSVALDIPNDLAVDSSRGFAILGDQAAFINPKAQQEITVASMKTGAVGGVAVDGGGVLVSTGLEHVFMTFGNATEPLASTFTKVVCGPSADPAVLNCADDDIPVGNVFYGAMGSDGKRYPGELFVAQNSGTSIERFPVALPDQVCEFATFQAGSAPHIFFPTPSGVIGWSKYNLSDSIGGFEIAGQDTCDLDATSKAFLPGIQSTFGVAQAEDDIVFIAFVPGTGVTAYHASTSEIDPEPIQYDDGTDALVNLPAFASPTVAYRPRTATFLVPRNPTGLWECDASGTATTCDRFELGDTSVLEGRVFAVHADPERTVILQHGSSARLLCIDET